MFDLGRFTLRDMTRLGSTLRQLGADARSMEEVAQRVVRELYEDLGSGPGARACALVRFFKTHSFARLDEALQASARRLLPEGAAPEPELKCLTLLATAGDQAEWNERRRSRAHRAIPLTSGDLASRAPMIASLLGQLGVPVDSLTDRSKDLLVEPSAESFNVFYVPRAAGSPYISAQDFVEAAGIESVLGFGGRLPRGDIFAVVLFTKIAVPRETAALFATLALNVKTAALPFEAVVFDADRALRGHGSQHADVDRLKARVATLQQLLEVYEDNVCEQADRLFAEQERILLQKTLLECQEEASLDGSLSVAADGRILFANRRFAEMWGLPPPELGSKAYGELLLAMADRTRDPGAFLEGAASAEEGGGSRQEIALKDGRFFERYTAPILSQEGRLLGRVWHYHDISAFKEIDRLKDEFVSAVSHELRTPITSILGSLDLMASGAMAEPGEVAELTRVAQRNCQRLVRLVDDVLDIEKIGAGRMEVRPRSLELSALAEQAVASMRPYARGLGVEIVLEDDCPGARVHSDPDRLFQVLENLLSNAAKFSPRGETVRVRLRRRGRWLRVEVEDRGPGIAPEDQERLFERFARIAAPAGEQKTGTGLGLHLARALVQELGGRIGFTSEPAAGSCFHFELPES